MNDTTKKIAGTAGSLLLLGSMGAGAVTAFAEEAPEAAPAGDELFGVNDSPIARTVGGANQLWLGSTSARYFAKNIVSITVETRDEAPAAPGSEEAGDTYANLPNVGVFFGGDVA